MTTLKYYNGNGRFIKSYELNTTRHKDIQQNTKLERCDWAKAVAIDDKGSELFVFRNDVK